ncbi:MAG: peptide ABC transporter ATP-binding protein, partial [Proteobacteria bacterium]|nr:peptide ABC transporter ATP-binding protein [Pseudomonadota bacterium]
NLGIVARYADRVNMMYAGRLIERGTCKEIYHNPRHPYTIGLLRSVPRLDQPRKAKLDPIEGQPPEMVDLPPSCSFLARCKFAVDRCADEAPPLMKVGDDHFSACWVAEELGN